MRPRISFKKESMDKQRMLFINGQVAKGNLKKKRARRRTEIFQRMLDRIFVNQLLPEDEEAGVLGIKLR